MPKAVDFEGSNFVFTKPPSMTDEECGSLHVNRGEDGQNVSCWELTEEELCKVMKTKKIWLWVWADRHPPVAIDVDNPFEAEEKSDCVEKRAKCSVCGHDAPIDAIEGMWPCKQCGSNAWVEADPISPPENKEM